MRWYVVKVERDCLKILEDPIAGTANLVDAMLVIAVGLLVFWLFHGTCKVSFSLT